MNKEAVDGIRVKCWDRALEAYGTGYIFERRAASLRVRLKVLAFLGIVVPASIGSVVLAFGTNPAWLPYLVGIAGALGVIQLVGSVWSLTARWEDAYTGALESLSSNHRLSNSYQRLAENPPGKLAEVELRFSLLEKEDELVQAADYKRGISEKEKRRGMRAALRKYRRECAGCNKIPVSMRPSKCEVCGNF